MISNSVTHLRSYTNSAIADNSALSTDIGASNDKCFMMFHNVLKVFHDVLLVAHDVLKVVHNVSQCFTCISGCFTMFNNILCLASRATIGDRAADDRLWRLRDCDNAAGIGDNSAEIGDDAAGIINIAANVIPSQTPSWMDVPGRQIPEGLITLIVYQQYQSLQLFLNYWILYSVPTPLSRWEPIFFLNTSWSPGVVPKLICDAYLLLETIFLGHFDNIYFSSLFIFHVYQIFYCEISYKLFFCIMVHPSRLNSSDLYSFFTFSAPPHLGSMMRFIFFGSDWYGTASRLVNGIFWFFAIATRLLL